nr:hypothetical protein [Tanacetum cinerariifolium]
MPWRHPDLYVVDELPTAFDQGHVDRLSAHVIKLRNIPEGVLAQFGISKVWRNPLCDLVIRRPNGTVMSIYDFIRMPSLDQTKVSEEPHDLGIPLQERVIDHTTAPAPPGTAVHVATLEEIVVTRPDHEVVTKAKNATNRKASTRSKVSTNVTKNTKVGKKNSRARSGATRDTHHFVMVDARVLDTGKDASISHITEPKDTDYYVDEPCATEHEEDGYIGSDGGSSDSPPPYTKKEWDGVHTVNLVLLNKGFFKDPKTLSLKQQRDDLRKQSRFTIHANEEIARFTSKLALESSARVSLGAGARDCSSTPSAKAYGHIGTPEHLKKKKPSGSGDYLVV